MSKQLQTHNADLCAATELVQGLTDALQHQRDSEDELNSLLSRATSLCHDSDISTDVVMKRSRRLPRRFENTVITDTIGLNDSTAASSADMFRTRIYLPVIDTMISELNRRFSKDSCSLMRGIQCLDPTSKSFLNLEMLQAFENRYDVDEQDLLHEVYQARRLIERKAADGHVIHTMQDLAAFIYPFKDAFACLFSLINIGLVLPVNTASCERRFSTMRQIKTYLRNSMADDRLSNLSVLSCEFVRAKSLDMDLVVDEFDSKHQNRRIALH